MNEDFYTQYCYGSSELGGESEARFLAKGTSPIAQIGNTVIRFQPEQPAIILGGAGSGKFSNLGAYQLVHPSTGSFFVLDIGGQYMSTTWHYNLAMKRDAYAINVHGESLYPDINDPVDLFSILKNDAMLFDNSREIADMALTKSEREGDNAWVGQDALRWLSRCFTSKVRLEGRVTPKSLWHFINAIDTDSEFLKAWGRACEKLPNMEHSTFREIYEKKQTSEKHYGAVMGKIKSDLDWLSSQAVADAISGQSDYLSFLGRPDKKVGIYYVIRAGSAKGMESLTRMVVGIAQLHCVRANLGARPLFYLEEAATCGNADFIKRAASEYRKFMQSVFVYQSHGQLTHLFGKSGAQEIVDSCGLQIYLGGGIRDIESARRLAETIGKKTIHIDDPMAQADRDFHARSATWQALWSNRDVVDAARAHEHEIRQSLQQRKAGRYALDPAEIMRLENKLIVLAPGRGLQSILADKLLPYWQNPAMAGRYAPDPLFPPLERVQIQRRFLGKTTRRFIREPVPAHLAHLPNHINGEIAYVEGYRTW